MAEASRLGRVLAALVPREPEGLGLLALMEIQASRTRARVGPHGEPVLLLDQDRTRWDWVLIRNALEALDRAQSLGGARGPYVLQASIAACHARARTADATDWALIVRLYDALRALRPSPVVDLNRAVALSYAVGPAAALAAVDAVADSSQLAGYHLVPSVRADLLVRLGRHGEARVELLRAASLTRNEAERDLLLGRAARAEADERAAGG
jgi:predicted RNA polymerase sigma factor